MKKKYFVYPLVILFSSLLIGMLSLFLVLFFYPLLIINPTNLNTVLTKSKVLKQWSWQDAKFTHEWRSWNDRIFQGHFEKLCLKYENESAALDTCLDEFSWKINLVFNSEDGLKVKTLKPLRIVSSSTHLDLKESKKKTAPPDVWFYWKTLWGDLIPDMEVDFKQIVLNHKQSFNFALTKINNDLNASAKEFHLRADPRQIVLTVPKPYPVPGKLGLGRPLYFRDMKLVAQMQKSGIPLFLTGGLEALTIEIKSYLDLPLKNDSLIQDLLLKTTADLKLPDVRGNLKRFGPKPFDVLPAPLNVMDGNISSHLVTEKAGDPDSILFKGVTVIDLKSVKQVLNMEIRSDVVFNLVTKKTGAILLGLDFHQVALQLPRLSKKSLPPQFFPDSRIKSLAATEKKLKKEAEEDRSLFFRLDAQGDNALQILTELLDEPLRLNFDLFIKDSRIQNGFLDILPLKTTVFKRPIKISSMRVKFDYPLEPVIEGSLVFLLPEYKISLFLNGPISKPRYAFSSVPPLPQNDIYAVLLFGRPMTELNSEDNTAAKKTRQLLAQGILSLSVLYFLAGSPVEYVGLDPKSGEATTQIGLDSKSSLRVGAGEKGLSSTAVRRSLGKGWYLDTSVQATSSVNATQEKTYGVLLERIIAY